MFDLEDLLPQDVRPFNVDYRCYSVAILNSERQEVDRGGKIILPPSALVHMNRLNIEYPMMFKLTNNIFNRSTHSGVLEFVADEGLVYLPYWMMRHLLLDEGDILNVQYVSLPIATYSKFQPLTENFLEIADPKAVLENCLRGFACLTTGDLISIHYNNRDYQLSVLDTQPGPAVNIIECDMNVDFVPPTSTNTDPETTPQSGCDLNKLMEEQPGFFPFKGKGNRLDGKRKREPDGEEEAVPPKRLYRRGIPDYNYRVGVLTFQRTNTASSSSTSIYNDKKEEKSEEFKSFSGKGYVLIKKEKEEEKEEEEDETKE